MQTELRSRAEHDAILRSIRARLQGARYELRTALEESASLKLGSNIAIKLDHALFEIDSAINIDALKPK